MPGERAIKILMIGERREYGERIGAGAFGNGRSQILTISEELWYRHPSYL